MKYDNRWRIKIPRATLKEIQKEIEQHQVRVQPRVRIIRRIPLFNHGAGSSTYNDLKYIDSLFNQPTILAPRNQVSESIENRHGPITKETDTYVRAGNVLITALSLVEQKFCADWEKAKTAALNKLDGLPPELKGLTTFLSGFTQSVVKNATGLATGDISYKDSYQITYQNGQIVGDIASIVIGIMGSVGGINLIQKGVGAGIVFTASGQIELTGGVAAAVTVGVTSTAAGIKVTINASKKLGEDIKKGSGKGESGGKGDSKTDEQKLNFKSKKLLDSYYDKHKNEFGDITKEQYLKGANDLINSSGKNVLSKVRANGDTIYYNKSTNEFAIKTSDGTIRTYFKPKDGIKYYKRQ